MNVEGMYKNACVAITGGLGSIGEEIVKALEKIDVDRIIVIDNRETSLFYSSLDRENIEFVYGDVRDENSIRNALEGANIVFHTAAMKHLSVCENHPYEAVMTNILGTHNVLRAAMDVGVERVVVVSTDKAVEPTNVLGSTKLIAESIAKSFSSKIAVSIARFGNVLGSRGSVLEIWERSVRQRGKIPVTNPEMTRFFITPDDCARKLLYVGSVGGSGEIYIIKSPSAKIGTMAEVFREIRGGEIEIVGIRAGEKLHEKLVAESEINYLWENDEFFVVSEDSPDDDFERAYIRDFSSKSEEFLLDKEGVRKMLISALNISQ